MKQLIFIFLFFQISQANALNNIISNIDTHMVNIPAGCFEMGTSLGDRTPAVVRRESPVHNVCLKTFKLSKFEVTQSQWKALMGANPSAYQDHQSDIHPVENISWNDAQKFIKKLNKLTGKNYRLPTESEWEYAARAGTATPYYWSKPGDFNYSSTRRANYGHEVCCASYTSGHDHWENTSPVIVPHFEANRFGLHAMLGNVSEFVQDCWYPSYSHKGKDSKARVHKNCTERVIRGGNFLSSYLQLRTAYRTNMDENYRYITNGLRLAHD